MSGSKRYSKAQATARDYYDSPDADGFYATIRGGEDIHVGLYRTPDESIARASRRTVERMAGRLAEPGVGERIRKGVRVLDIGSGYGGAARYLAGEHGCEVVCLDLSAVENDRNRRLTEKVGLSEKIEVLEGNFEEVPAEDEAFDVVWSQDAILHSGDRGRVFGEVARVLRPGGQFVFTDPMKADGCPDEVLQPILDRIHLDSLGSPGFYRQTAREVGLEEVAFEDHTAQLTRHYARVLQESESREEELAGVCGEEYVSRMKAGLQHWVDGGERGRLAWGIFHFRRGAGAL
nr:methyltransferase domain-containing protein [Rubrobacter indicoceani]